MGKYTEREIYRNIRIIERDIERAQKNKREDTNKRKEFEESIKNIDESIVYTDQYINEQKQKLQYWTIEKEKDEKQWSLKTRLGPPDK